MPNVDVDVVLVIVAKLFVRSVVALRSCQKMHSYDLLDQFFSFVFSNASSMGEKLEIVLSIETIKNKCILGLQL